ncbi:MAG: KUP/HAK/KT family potassium transporter [Deltaproteobacteria bacterium]|nr:KUP/HAK/KT family potassium transporter [Deltaproteobacteria bacterium]
MNKNSESFFGGVVKSMGIVFGDIGTSPIYTLSIVFILTPPTEANILGVLSLVFWTITTLVTLQYAWLAMSLNRNGQGGQIVLREILVSVLKRGRLFSVIGIVSFVGVSLLLGDGAITPAISILSAVEGLQLVPGLGGIGQTTIIAVAIIFAVCLFSIQKKGVDKLAGLFGPIMLFWFVALALSGIVSIISAPTMLKAVSPHYAFSFLSNNGFLGFIVLSEVVLCVTGAEVLYADMGHLGKRPIINAWCFVFFVLIANYIGQGIFLLQNPEAKTILFAMVKQQAPFLYVPFLLLTITATMIASQAVISGVFSVVYQGIMTRLLPLLRITYTSSKIKSQIYIGTINWLLLTAVILVIINFKNSSNLAHAYGLAVVSSMSITCLMMILVFYFTKASRWKILLAVALLAIDLTFLSAATHKIPQGAYWALIIAAVPLTTMLVWVRGQKMLFRSLRPLDLETFLVGYEQVYTDQAKIKGTALFFTRDWRTLPPYFVHCILRDNIIYEHNILISIITTENPKGMETKHTKNIALGLEAFEIRAGYMEVFSIEQILRANNIIPKVVFYGTEDIATRNPIWKIFIFIKRVTSNFVQFHDLPPSKLHGIVTRVEL